MQTLKEIIISLVKEQAELFLQDAGEFFPFGIYINQEGKVVPFSATVDDENDQPLSTDIIALLEKHITNLIATNEIKIGVIAIDAVLTENGGKQDAIQLRFFESTAPYYQYLKYQTIKGKVIFWK